MSKQRSKLYLAAVDVKDWAVWRVRKALRWGMLKPAGVLDVPSYVVRAPSALAGHKVLLYVSMLREGALPLRTLFAMREWRKNGYKVVLVVIADRARPWANAEVVDLCEAILVRENFGYDFAAWSAALQSFPMIREASMLAIANDSTYGPLRGFGEMLKAVEDSSCDIVAMTESDLPVRHIQSYLMFFKKRALRSPAFTRFWHGIRNGRRQFVIDQYEIPLGRTFTASGLQVGALWSASSKGVRGNPTFAAWDRLPQEGVPFLKISAIRDERRTFSDEAWRNVLIAHGWNMALVEEGERTVNKQSSVLVEDGMTDEEPLR